MRLISNLLKNLDAIAAKYQLEHLVKKSSEPLEKLLDSALANAQNNFGLSKANLFIKEIIVNEGAKLKRFRPKGFGSTSPIEKKTSHIKIILEERIPGLKATKDEIKKAEHEIGTVEEKQAAEKKMKAKPEIKKEIGKKGVFGKISRRIFQRKAI